MFGSVREVAAGSKLLMDGDVVRNANELEKLLLTAEGTVDAAQKQNAEQTALCFAALNAATRGFVRLAAAFPDSVRSWWAEDDAADADIDDGMADNDGRVGAEAAMAVGETVSGAASTSASQARRRLGDWIRARRFRLRSLLLRVLAMPGSTEEIEALQVAALDCAVLLLGGEAQAAHQAIDGSFCREIAASILKLASNTGDDVATTPSSDQAEQAAAARAVEHALALWEHWHGTHFLPLIDVRFWTVDAVRHTARDLLKSGANPAPFALLAYQVLTGRGQAVLPDEHQMADPQQFLGQEIEDPDAGRKKKKKKKNKQKDTAVAQTQSKSYQKRVKRGNRPRRLRQHRQLLSDAWLSLLRLPRLPRRVYRAVLNIMQEQIFPTIPDPCVFNDFLLECFALGGMDSLLALGGTFTLIAHHNLECPQFFSALYRLLNAHLFTEASLRDRFFELANMALGSSHVAAYTGASFIKRAMRLSVRGAPPPFILQALLLSRNVLLKHPATQFLVHSVPEGAKLLVSPNAVLLVDETTNQPINRHGAQDSFVESEDDPSLCRVAGSSLWELSVLRQHYFHAVARLVKAIERRPTAANVVGGPQSDVKQISYAQLVAAELARPLAPPTAHSWKLAAGINIDPAQVRLFNLGPDNFLYGGRGATTASSAAPRAMLEWDEKEPVPSSAVAPPKVTRSSGLNRFEAKRQAKHERGQEYRKRKRK